jgi:parallel beta-helix repeat protein
LNRAALSAVIFLIISLTGAGFSHASLPSHSAGVTIFVGGLGPGNYSSIQDAINASSDGDTIFVFNTSSPYYGPVSITKRLRLIGQDRNTTIVGISDVYSNTFLVASDDVNIEGFWIQNHHPDRSGSNCILNLVSNNLSIHDNIISGGFVGVNIGDHQYKSNHLVITNNIVQDCNTGLEIFESSSDTISNNLVVRNHDSLSFRYCSDVLFSNNIVSGNLVGIDMYRVMNADIAGNRVDNNSFGFRIKGWYDYDRSDNIQIHDNIIASNPEQGIALSDVIGITIIRNHFERNGDRAFSIFIGKIVTVSQNDIIENKPRHIYFQYVPLRNQIVFSENYWSGLERNHKLVLGSWGIPLWGNYYGPVFYLEIPLFKLDRHPKPEPFLTLA